MNAAHVSPVVAVALAALLASTARPAESAESPQDMAWVNVTNNVGGEKWGYAGVTAIACVPGADQVIAGVSAEGLWSSTDGGQTWTPLGEADAVKIANRPCTIVFDPKDPRTFWVSGNYGPGLFKTADGGKTFERIGTLNHLDGVAIDFADPERKTLLVGMHEKSQGILASTDGGKIWRNIGKQLPPKTNHTAHAVVIDSQTFVTSAAGWAKGMDLGIFRTTDGGKTWKAVSDLGAVGRPLIASDGRIYWAQFRDQKLLASTDQGETWTELDGPVKRAPIELPGARLVSWMGKQLYASVDAAATWTPLGPEAPFEPDALAYNEKRNGFFASRSTERKTDQAVARLDLPGPVVVVIAKRLVVWDGEDAAKGKAWANPEGAVTLAPQGEVVHAGKGALRLNVKGKGWAGAGWNWRAWWPKDAGDDLAGFTNLTFWVKVGEGTPKGTSLKVALGCSGEGAKPTGQVEVAKYCPAFADGEWHEVVVPLADLYAAAKEQGFNPKKAWQIDFAIWRQDESTVDVYVDDIAFDDRPAPAGAADK